ncbi:sporulation protein YunB [Anaerovoracaceae bacterium 41-7]|uniref:sporulation protein YunB n=1 Tax=Anaerovoracaceae TaxID=543314 RepID=UPI00203C3F25|nr:sporulation protein YunB [Senimuribacter intestinalis]
MGRRSSAAGWFWKKTAIGLLIFALGCLILAEGLKRQIGPNIDAISHLKARGMVTELINETIRENFSDEDYADKLFLIKTGDDGKMQMVQANTSLINKMVSSFAESLQKKYEAMDRKIVEISYGTLLGSKVLSQTGFGVEVKLLPLAVTKYDFETEFESQGINQTKYKIYIVLESSVQILQPFSKESVKVINKVLISEAVIVGDVPDSYVNVPKEDILDAT